jgi:AraC-like DNA-binding protein
VRETLCYGPPLNTDGGRSGRTRVLWIDDEVSADDALLRLLTLDYAYQIDCVRTGEAGLVRTCSAVFDIIVLDVRLEDMSGLTVLERMMSRGVRAPILVVTAHYLEPEIQREALRAGAAAFMCKSLHNHDEWAGRIRTVIEASRDRSLRRSLASVSNGASPDARVNEVIDRLKQTPGAPLDLESLARDVGMSSSGFRHLWRRVIGSPLARFRRDLRLDASAVELTSTHRTVSEIAYDLGFNDLRYFERAFRRRFGISPTEYRRRSHRRT